MENSKQYLIQFIASMQGDKLTIQQLKKIETETRKLEKGMGGAGKATDTMGGSMMNLAKRALMVAPIWMLMRSAIMLVTSTIREAIQANIAFQENMARIRTVVTANSTSVEGDMTRIRSAVLAMATNSRISLADLTEGMYFLRTAGLTTDEALGAFASTVATATGTTNSLKDTTRIVVGIYNTMGKSLGDNLTVTEKFQHINDALTYTYATQEVQLQELGASYLKLAPYLTGLNDEFIDLITMIGFLNTKMLKSGRAGLLTGRAILQLTQNSKKLAEIFDITFDPDKPVNFLETLALINAKIGDTTKLTAEQSKAIQTVFETRAGVPIRILLDNFKELTEVLEKARTGSEDFAETMKDIMEHTVTAQMQRLKNIIAVSANEFFSAASQGADFVQVLKNMNDQLDTSRKDLKELANLISFVTFNWKESTTGVRGFVKELKELSGIDLSKFATAGPGGAVLAFMGILDKFGGLDLIPGFKKHKEERNKLAEEGIKKQQDAIKLNKIQLNLTKYESEEERHLIALLKEKGATELEIAKFKLEQFELSAVTREKEDENLERLKLTNNILEAQSKIRNTITNTFLKAQTDLLKTQGATELQIIQAQLQQLQNQKGNLTTESYLTKLTDIRIRQAIELANLKQKELQTQTNIALQYEKADKFTRPRIRRAIELRGMGEGQLRTRFADPYDKQVIIDYWNYFTDKQQEAFGKILAQDYGIDFKIPDLEDKLTLEMKKILLNTEDIQQYWINWSTFGKQEITDLSAYYQRVLFGKTVPSEGLAIPTMPSPLTVDLKHELLLNFKVDSDSLEAIPERIGREVEELLSKDDFIKRLSRRLREII